jgi:enoyl-CoA hydratase/carnithine racemase
MNAIRMQYDGPIGRLLIDKPARSNAFSRDMWRALPALLAKVVARPFTRVVTLQSAAPGYFCAGADISEFEAIHKDAQESRRANAEIHDAVHALAACPLPTLAFVDGACVGGGVALALACDLRLASERALFAVTPARLGLSYHPDDVSRLVQVCGPASAAELLFTGRSWPALRAQSTGLVNLVLGNDGFAAGCDGMATAAAANSAHATRALKQCLAAVRSGDPGGLQEAVRRFEGLFDGPDFREGRDAFLQKRPARFPSHHDAELP